MIKRNKYIIRRGTGCWEWQGARTNGGYGRLKYKNQAWMAHRFSYVLHKGPIPEGLVIMHKCDNPCCINPEHLMAGTQKQNMEDCKAKGRLGARGSLNNRNPKVSPYEHRVHLIRVALSKGKTPAAIAKKYRLDPRWVRKVIEVEIYGNH